MENINSDLLKLDMNEEGNQQLYQELLMKAAREGLVDSNSNPMCKSVVPKAGFCIKCRMLNSEEKVFVNVCTSDTIPCPPQVEEDDIVKMLQSEEESEFRIKMSIGEHHLETDNQGKACVVYDVAINPEFLIRVTDKKRPVLHSFFCTVLLEGIENKFKISLDRNCKILKNKKYIGKIQEQYVRLGPPKVSEVATEEQVKPLVAEMKAEIPSYTIIKEPSVGKVEFLIAEFKLPKISNYRQVILDIGEDRVVLDCRPHYFLDIFLPFSMNEQEAGAQFDEDSKLLSLTIPVTAEMIR